MHDPIEALRHAKTSEQVEACLPELEAKRAAAQARYDALPANDDEILMPASERDRLRRERAKVREDLDDLGAALRVGERLRYDLETKEREALLRTKMQKARDLVPEQARLLRAFAKQAKALAETAEKLKAVSDEISAARTFARNGKLYDLDFPDAVDLAFQRHREAWERFHGAGPSVKVTPALPVPNPVQPGAMVIPFIWPKSPAALDHLGGRTPYEL